MIKLLYEYYERSVTRSVFSIRLDGIGLGEFGDLADRV